MSQVEEKTLTSTVKLTTTTLGELGPVLPCGIMANGVRSRGFRLRPFRLKEEKELGAIRDGKQGRGMTYGEFVSEVLVKMVQTLGPHNFDSLNHNEKRLIIAKMLVADVLYLYLYLRHDAIGADEPISMEVTCPKCRSEFTFHADLNTLEVRVPGNDLGLTWLRSLRDGIVIRGTKTFELTLGPLTWGTLERREFATSNQGQREALTVTNSIVAADGVSMNPLVVTEQELDELTKYDLLGIIDDIEQNAPGPIMAVSPECSMCRSDFTAALDWQYQSFFSRSSRSRPSRH